MDFGYLTGNHADGISPGELGRELEGRGYTSFWVPRAQPYPDVSADRLSPTAATSQPAMST